MIRGVPYELLRCDLESFVACFIDGHILAAATDSRIIFVYFMLVGYVVDLQYEGI